MHELNLLMSAYASKRGCSQSKILASVSTLQLCLKNQAQKKSFFSTSTSCTAASPFIKILMDCAVTVFFAGDDALSPSANSEQVEQLQDICLGGQLESLEFQTLFRRRVLWNVGRN